MAGHPRGRRLAAAVLAVLLALALLTLTLRQESNSRGTGTSPAASPNVTRPPTATSAPAQPPLPLTKPPSGVTWELFQGVALPTSRTDGPSRVAGSVHAGFSRTPTGALLATEQIGVRGAVDTSLSGLRQIADEQLVDGPGKSAWLALLGQLRENEPPAGDYAQIVGFRYITYTPDVAVISTATKDTSGRLQVGTDTVRWVDGDWKLEKPPSGLQQPQAVQGIAGFVPWAGVP